MKKIFMCVLSIIVAVVTSFSYEVSAASEMIAYDDWQILFDEINNTEWMENGQEIFVDSYVITYSRNELSAKNGRSVYSDTKTVTETFDISNKDSAAPILTVSQSVTYKINDYISSVEITAFTATIKSLSSGYNYSVYQNTVINNSQALSYVTAYKTFRIYSASAYTFLLNCNVKVYRTGLCDFKFDFI